MFLKSRVKKFRFDIELIMISIFTILVFTQSLSLLKPITDFLASIFQFSFFNLMIDQAWTTKSVDDQNLVIILILLVFFAIFAFAKVRSNEKI